ncbi:hypothetical protein [Schaalia sp. ZJ1691]|uniref:hypothetical protein n=1 Tax=Schaalia sp. ZJ1691 TaxID=2709404 RepID=UPI0013EAD857|nr:hypothetical protein [Schaalia sp. ZJ1691]
MSTAKTLRPSPRRDVFDLVNCLARAGWGEELRKPAHRGARVILRDLADAAYDAHTGLSGQVTTTANQIADRTGYSRTWVYEALRKLEALGIIRWWRGGIKDGGPSPSTITIVKTAICDLVEVARTWHDQVLSDRARKTIERINRTVKFRFCRGKKPAHTSHVQLAGTPHSYVRNEGVPAPSFSASDNSSDQPKGQEMNAIIESYLPPECSHGNRLPRACNRCQSAAWQTLQAKRKEEEAGRKRAEAKTMSIEAHKAAQFTEYMETTYPDARKAEWPEIIKNDPRAGELASA